MPIVLDASITLAWCFRDEQTPYALEIARRLPTDPGLVPSIWVLEVTNALLVAERRERLSPADLAEAQSRLGDLPVTVDNLPLERALGSVLNVARQEQLSAYDATYVELAMREGVPFATVDERLRAAAERLGVTLA